MRYTVELSWQQIEAPSPTHAACWVAALLAEQLSPLSTTFTVTGEDAVPLEIDMNDFEEEQVIYDLAGEVDRQ